MSAGSERVVVLSSSYPTAPDDPSGHFVRTHAERLAAAGADVRVLVPGPAGDPVREGPVVVHRLGADALFGWPGAVARVRSNPLRLGESGPLAWRMWRALSALGRVDRVVTHWMLPTLLPLFHLAEPASLGRPPLDVVSHGADVRLLLALPPHVRALFVRLACRRARRITFVAATVRDALVGSLPTEVSRRLVAMSEVRPSPIDVPARSALVDPRPSEAPRVPYAVWVGRDVPDKRLDLALEAAARAEIRLCVLGATRTSGDLRTHFLGTRSRPEALAWIAHADVLLSTSSIEAAPTAAREARALGVAVVACEAGDLSLWADDDPGIHLVSNDPGDIAAALRHHVRHA